MTARNAKAPAAPASATEAKVKKYNHKVFYTNRSVFVAFGPRPGNRIPDLARLLPDRRPSPGRPIPRFVRAGRR